MNTDHELQRQITGVFANEAPSGYPEELLGRVLTTTSRTRPRPTWLADIKEPPMRIPSRVVVGSPTLRLATILALTLALALALAGAVAGAASLLPNESVPDPYGPARNGSLVYEQDGDIYLADADGGNPRAIVTGDTNDWSPWFSHDGRTIAFARGDDPGYEGMLADADGSNVRPLLADADEWNIEFMPDDSEIVGTRLVDGKHVLSMIDIASGSIRDLDVGGLDPNYFQMPRPPDGREIIFTAYTTPDGPEEGLYAIKPDGTGLRSIGTTYSRVLPEGASGAAPGPLQDPVLSPDGSTIAYWNWESRAGAPGYHPDAYLHQRDLDTGEDLPVLFDVLGASNPKGDDNGLLPHYSPDGTMVVFDGCLAPVPLCYGPLDGSEPSHSIGPAWYYTERQGFGFSPDGTKVILTLKSGSTIIDLESGAQTAVLQGISAQPWWQRLAH